MNSILTMNLFRFHRILFRGFISEFCITMLKLFTHSSSFHEIECHKNRFERYGESKIVEIILMRLFLYQFMDTQTHSYLRSIHVSTSFLLKITWTNWINRSISEQTSHLLHAFKKFFHSNSYSKIRIRSVWVWYDVNLRFSTSLKFYSMLFQLWSILLLQWRVALLHVTTWSNCFQIVTANFLQFIIKTKYFSTFLFFLRENSPATISIRSENVAQYSFKMRHFPLEALANLIIIFVTWIPLLIHHATDFEYKTHILNWWLRQNWWYRSIENCSTY